MLMQTLERKASQGSELWAQPDPASVKTLGPAVHRCYPSSLSLARQEKGSPRQARGCGAQVYKSIQLNMVVQLTLVDPVCQVASSSLSHHLMDQPMVQLL